MTVDVEPYETFVDIKPLGATHPRWHWRPRSRSLHLEWAQDIAPEGQVDVLTAMLEHLRSKRGLVLAQTQLVTELSVHRYPAYAARLARFAAQDPQWRAALKRSGRTGTQFYRYIVDATQDRVLHPELDAIFASLDVRPRLATVEKCLRSDHRPSPTLRAWLRQQGLTRQTSLPLGCLMANFRFEPPPRAMYLANAGVMVTAGETKVLFDPFFRADFGIYELVPKAIEDAIFAATPPFDGIDAVFISHHHGDHFSPDVAAAYLNAQPHVRLIGPAQAAAAVLRADGRPSMRDRIHAVRLTVEQPPARLSVGDLEIEAVRIPHAGWPTRHQHVENLAFRVTLDKRATVVHLGDADPQRPHFARHEDHWRNGRPPAAAFPPYWFFESPGGQSIVREYLRGLQTIGVHVPAAIPDAPSQGSGQGAFDLFTRPGETRKLHLSVGGKPNR